MRMRLIASSSYASSLIWYDVSIIMLYEISLYRIIIYSEELRVKLKTLTIAMLFLSLLSACSKAESAIISEGSQSNINSDSSMEITDKISTFEHFSQLEIVSATDQVPNGNFESGDLSNWYKESEDAPFNVCNDDVDIWDNIICKQDTYFLGYGASNYSGEEEQKTGRIRSSLFLSKGEGVLSFRLAGSNQRQLACHLIKYSPDGNHVVIKTFNNTRYGIGGLSGFIMVPYKLPIPENTKGQLLYLLLEDNANNTFAFINIDDIHIDYDVDHYFVSTLAEYCDCVDIVNAVKDAHIESIMLKGSGQRVFEYGETFNSDGLYVIANYDNHVQTILSKDKYLINRANYNSNKAGKYEIEIMCKDDFVKTTYEVEVLPQGVLRKGRSVVTNNDSILLIGDSQLDLWTNAKSDIGVFSKFNNIAVGGTQMPYWFEQIDRIVSFNPTYILFNIGGNDIRNGGFSPAEIVANIKNFLSTIHSRLPNCKVYLFTPCFSAASYYNFADKFLEINELYEAMASEIDYLTVMNVAGYFLNDIGMPDTNYFLQRDHLHYETSAYKIIASVFKKYLITE